MKRSASRKQGKKQEKMKRSASRKQGSRRSLTFLGVEEEQRLV
jgi:hypothetical protein